MYRRGGLYVLQRKAEPRDAEDWITVVVRKGTRADKRIGKGNGARKRQKVRRREQIAGRDARMTAAASRIPAGGHIAPPSKKRMLLPLSIHCWTRFHLERRAAAHRSYPEGVQANGNRRGVPIGKRVCVALQKPGVLIGKRTHYVFQRIAAVSLAKRAHHFPDIVAPEAIAASCYARLDI